MTCKEKKFCPTLNQDLDKNTLSALTKNIDITTYLLALDYSNDIDTFLFVTKLKYFSDLQNMSIKSLKTT